MNGAKVRHVSHPVDVFRHDGHSLVLHQSKSGGGRQVARADEGVKHSLQGEGFGDAPVHHVGIQLKVGHFRPAENSHLHRDQPCLQLFLQQLQQVCILN